VILQSDNAGCYHVKELLLGIPLHEVTKAATKAVLRTQLAKDGAVPASTVEQCRT
jgi:hypothetical protein